MSAIQVDWIKVVDEIGARFSARAEALDVANAFAAENSAELKRHRFFSAIVPRELGGGGVSYRQMAFILRRLAGYCGSTALALAMHQHLVAAAVFNFRSGKPGQKLLEAVAADEKVLISTGAKDWMESSGTMDKVDGGFRVTAAKPFASGSPAGSILVTSARYADPVHGPQVLHFPVPMSAKGVGLQENWRAIGMRATGSHTVTLDKVFVPEESVVLRRPRGEYHAVWNVVIAVAMPLISSVYAGIAEKAAQIAREQTEGKAEDAVLHIQLGELENLTTTVQLAVESMVAQVDEWRFVPSLSMANAILVRKSIAVRAAKEAVEKALEVTGGEGYFRHIGLDRPLRDIFAGQFHPLPEKRQQLFSGRLAAGLNPIPGMRANPAIPFPKSREPAA